MGHYSTAVNHCSHFPLKITILITSNPTDGLFLLLNEFLCVWSLSLSYV
jgi:hypothetical protein